jgi:hypothetical protein
LVYETPIKIVQEFRYLGFMLRNNSIDPTSIILDRINKCKIAFYSVMNKSKFYGLSNARVRLSLVQSLALTHLLYGAVIFACLADSALVLGTACCDNAVWYTAEILLRKMLRWALKSPRDTRCSFLYLICNCPTLQVLAFKRCVRFFRKCALDES